MKGQPTSADPTKGLGAILLGRDHLGPLPDDRQLPFLTDDDDDAEDGA